LENREVDDTVLKEESYVEDPRVTEGLVFQILDKTELPAKLLDYLFLME